MYDYNQNNEIRQTQEEIPVVKATVEQASNTTLGLISMICGIAAVFFLCCCPGPAVPCAIAAVILAFVEKSKNGEMSTYAKVGVGLGIGGFVLSIISTIAGIVIGTTTGVCSGLMQAAADPYGSSYYYY